MSGAGASRGGAGRATPFTDAFREGLKRCNPQAQAYGACLKAMLPDVEKGGCEPQFAALKTCFFSAVKDVRRRGGGK